MILKSEFLVCAIMAHGSDRHTFAVGLCQGGSAMHMLVINFGLKGITESQFSQNCEAGRPGFGQAVRDS